MRKMDQVLLNVSYYLADHINVLLRFRYKMECHRDEVVVRVSSIYDSLIGHGDTSALLEGGADSEIMRNTYECNTLIL